jgi:phosphotriesterase-related protein
MKINTVLGPISPEDLGITLVHEHITAAYPGWECDPLSRPYDREKIGNIALRALEPVKAYGVKSIVDATVIDLNRDVDVMKKVSEKLQINIICATGRYTEAEGKWSYLKKRSETKVGDIFTELYEGFMHEITRGIGQSRIKPGVIKVCTGDNHITPLEEAALKAAAKASKETGLPIITHTENGTMGPEQASLLIGEGVNPKRIMIGHMCGNPSLQYQLNALDQGVNVAFDRFGIELILPDKVRTATLIGLLKAGYAERIMVSHDCVGCGLGRGGKMSEDKIRLVTNWSFTHVFRNIIPALKKAGITDEQIRMITVDSPRRLFTGEQKNRNANFLWS